MNALIVEPDAELLASLAGTLRGAGYRVITAPDGDQAFELIQTHCLDLALVDVQTPVTGGLELCRRIREELHASTPLVLLTDSPDSAEVVDGLDLGVDDCVARSTSRAHLLARLRAVLRRAKERHHRLDGPFTLGYLKLDARAHTVSVNEVTHQLTVLEFRILSALARQAGRIIPHWELVQATWGYEGEDNTNLLKSHISHLRRKLNLPAHLKGIRAVRGIGYCLDIDRSHDARCWESHDARWSK